jgi:hypothetical protein
MEGQLGDLPFTLHGFCMDTRFRRLTQQIFPKSCTQAVPNGNYLYRGGKSEEVATQPAAGLAPAVRAELARIGGFGQPRGKNFVFRVRFSLPACLKR